MGNHHSSRSLNRDSNSSTFNVSNNGNQKVKRSAKQKFASPENLVLPVVRNGPQRLRSTDNGNILQNGGTISGRRNNQSSESSNDSEFTRYLQRKTEVCLPPTHNETFQTMFGHKKSHSDPDIIRKMLEENETEEDDDGRYESECNSNHRSIIAMSPSKAKIRSRKKKKAPEPPQPNTLPRMINGRNNLKCESQEIGKFNPTYDYSEAPRRPLPPLPLDEMPPPPPPPDYHKSIVNREILVSSGKNFQKNKRVVDKWKPIKSDGGFVEKRQRSKSLDRTEDYKLREMEKSSKSERFDRNFSLKNLSNSHLEETLPQQIGDKTKVLTQRELNDAIVDAAKKRAERVARTGMYRNSSFKSSMNLSDDAEAADTGQTRSNHLDLYKKERGLYVNGSEKPYQNSNLHLDSNKVPETYLKENGHALHSRDLRSHPNGYRKSFENETAESNVNPQKRKVHVNNDRYVVEQNKHHVNEHSERSGKEYMYVGEKETHDSYTRVNRDQYGNRHPQSNLAGPDTKSNLSDPHHFNDRRNSHTNNDIYLSNHISTNGNSNMVQYKNSNRNSQEHERKDNQEHRISNFNGIHDNLMQKNLVNGNSKNVMKKTNYSYYGLNHEVEEINGNNFSKNGAIHIKDSRNKIACDYKPINDNIFTKNYSIANNRVDLSILPGLVSDDQVVTIMPSSTISSSTISEEEMEINLQLRPTLPRRPIDIPRFSPTDVWKSINLDFFKSHQRFDVSSEEGDNIMEEKIHRINRAVAPRRMIPDRSGDSGISPDAGSPMFLNENIDSPAMVDNELCPIANVSNDDINTTWIPQHDLEDSECSSDTSPTEGKTSPNAVNGIMQPKLAMPNFMFPSRSLPRTDEKSGLDERDIIEKEKTRPRDRRKRHSKNTETQHFNSLRNLKRALGIRSKTTVVAEENGLDSNWSLSRSLPNFEDVNKEDEVKPENEVPEINVLDNIRRSNSESRMVHQENGRIYSARSTQNANPEWRKSFPGNPTDGHVMYLPEYRSTVATILANSQIETVDIMDSADVNNIDDYSGKKSNIEAAIKKIKCKKKFSYQSTIRQLEKRKIEEQIAKEVEVKEKNRETEQEWMNIVEDEFRKQRIREKCDVRQRLRIYNLQENKDSSNSAVLCNVDDSNVENFSDSVNINGYVQKPDPLCSIVNEGSTQILNSINGISQNGYDLDTAETSRKLDGFPSNLDIPHSEQVYDKHKQNYPQRTDSVQHLTERVRRAFISESLDLNNSVSQNIIRREEQYPQSYPIQGGIDRSSPGAYEVENAIIRTGGVPSTVQTNARKNVYVSNYTPDSGMKNNRQDNSYFDKERSPCSSGNVIQTLSAIEGAIVVDKVHNFSKTEATNDSINPTHDSASSFEDKDSDTRKDLRSNQADRQQPTGMKKWLRRQNRDHMCHENLPRPEPDGGSSSSDYYRYVNGRRERVNGRPQSVGANLQSNTNYRCSHGNEYPCSICNCGGNQSVVCSREGVLPSDPSPGKSKRSERARDDKKEIHPTSQVPNENSYAGNISEIPIVPPFPGKSFSEYELHTRLCRSNSGRTFESHSYYALERRKDDPTEFEPFRKRNSENPKGNLFSSKNFEKELHENVRKKSRDLDKRIRKFQSRDDYDSDESGSDRKKSRYQRHNVRGQKKKSLSEHREPSFSRNHPHRNGARVKSQPNGHPQNGRPASAPKNGHTVYGSSTQKY